MADADLHVTPLGDSALVLHLGERADEATWRRVHAYAPSLARLILEGCIPGARECVPAYTTITVYYDPLRATFAQVRGALEVLTKEIEQAENAPSRIVAIPVCYGGEYGSDLERVAEHAGLTPGEVVELHASTLYRVHMLGFAPGFPYLGGLSPRIATPRRATPRLEVAAGSVGIGGEQTGIYPLTTPGGWQIIGRTPRALFLPSQDPPTLLRAGDSVRFEPISAGQFADWREGPP